MKPTASHPTISTGRSRHSQGSCHTSWSGSWGGGGGGGVSRRCCKVQVDKNSTNPTWMRKLEERYQRLHRKLASIPTYTSTAGRFNLITKRFLNDTLAKTALKNRASARHNNDDDKQHNGNAQFHHQDRHYQDDINDDDCDNDSSKDVTTPDSRHGYSDSKNNRGDSNIINQYATSRRPSQALLPTQDKQIKGEKNGKSAKEEWNEELSALTTTLHDSLPFRCNKCRHLHLKTNGTHRSSPPPVNNGPASTHPSPLPDTVVGTGDNTVGHSGSGRCTPVLKLYASERDEAARGNQSPDLAPPAGLADVSSPAAPISSSPSDRYPDTGLSQQPRNVDRLGSEAETEVCVCGAVRHGPGSTMVTERQPAAAGRGRHGIGGTTDTDKTPGEMGDSTPAVRTLNLISTTVGNKRGSNTRAVQPNASSHLSRTASKFAAADSSGPPSSSRRRGGGEGGGGGEEPSQQQDVAGERPNLQFLPQMSVEARHAISETLKEMGTIGDEKTELENTDDGDEEDIAEDYEDANNNNNNNDDDDDDNDNSITSLPSVAEPLPTLPLQRRSWHPDTSTTQQQSRENSLTASQRTTNARQKSYRSNRNTDNRSTRNVDNKSTRNVDNSSVNTGTARGGKSPRRSRTRPGSLYTSVTVRLDPKSERTLDTEDDLPSDGGEAGKMDLDLLSMASVGNAVTNRSTPEVRQDPVQRMHLPAITSRTEPNLMRSPRKDNNIRHVNYRIRGVGSYRVPRENTFEITAPDFDIRYRDVITCQRGDRETPPPEIFEKSVGKVREWLSKHYSPYSPS